jgi:predicted esterase
MVPMLPSTRALKLVATALLCSIQIVGLAAEDDIVAVCRHYLDANADKRSGLETRIRGFRGDVGPVIAQLSIPADSNRQDVSGVLAGQLFQSPDLERTYDKDLLHYFVPVGYSPVQPIGLLIFMHGGGGKTPREFPRHVVTHPDDDPQSYGLQPHFKNAPFIIVAPSAPWNENTGARWNLTEADKYIAAVIQECRYRFNIDTDRIVLGGYSMGGFGAFHLCQRLSDRLAGSVIFSGAWKTTHWKAWTGLPVFIRHGKADAVAPGLDGIRSRPRYTDVFYARAANQKLGELSADSVYFEDDGGHSIRDSTNSWSQLARWMQDKRRDAYARHVVAVSPRGWKSSTDTPTPHCRWITIHEIGDAKIAFDAVELNGPSPTWKETREAFDSQTFQLGTKDVQAGVVDAKLEMDNQITIHTENVKRFSLWLHPSMVDFSRPVRITLNGKQQTHSVNASLLDALRSYSRRHDWGLTYPEEIVFAVE